MARAERKKFQYKPRTAEQVKDRANRRGGAYDSYLKDKVTLFKPKGDTDYAIRILPPTWDGAEHYGIDIFVHYGIGADNNSYLCHKLMKTGQTCPICIERERAERDGEEEYAKELFATKRVLAWMIDRDNEKEGPMGWAMPVKQMDTEILHQSYDKRTDSALNIDDPDDGYDIEFSREGSGQRTKYVGVKIARNSSPLHHDEATQERWLNFVIDNPLPDMLEFHDADYISEVFSGAVASTSKTTSRATRSEAPSTREAAQDEKEEQEAPPPATRRSRVTREEPAATTTTEEDDEPPFEPDTTKEDVSATQTSSRDRLAALRARRGGK